MLTCARGCVGRKLRSVPAACADPEAIEPLLFLYPRWFQIAAKQPSHAFSTQGRRQVRKSQARPPISAAQSINSDQHLHPSISGTESTVSGDHVLEHEQPLNFSNCPERTIIGHPSALAGKSWKPYDEKAVRSQIKGREKSKAKISRTFDALELARDLSKLRHARRENTDTITLDTSFLLWYTGTTGENTWRHYDGSNCMIHVNQSVGRQQSRREVTLIGSPRAREIASQRLRWLQNTFRSYDLSKQNQVTNHPSESALGNRHYARVDQLPEPRVWNLRTFAEYVKTIISARAPRGVERLLYRNDDTFNKTAARVLIELFDKPELRQHHSSFALRKVLEFCESRTEVAAAAKHIWSAAITNGIIPDIACFNLCLSRFIRVRNVIGARGLIQQMENSHIRPNSATWACLFRGLKDKHDQARFIKLPGFQVTANDKVSREIVIQSLLSTTFEPSDTDLTLIPRLHEHMSATFGHDWLSPSVVQHMLELSTKNRSLQSIPRILQLAAEHSVQLGQDSLTALLGAVLRTGWFEDIILLLKTGLSEANSTLNSLQLELLFTEAWKQHLPNTCRVLWQYAATHGEISYMMLTKVSRALAQNTSPAAHTGARIDALVAGIAVGVREDSKSRHANRHNVAVSQALAGITQWTPHGEPRHEQLQLAHALLEHDLQSWQRFQPMTSGSLLDLLDKSVALDKSWLDEGFLKQYALPELLVKAIHITLDPTSTTTSLSRLCTTNTIQDNSDQTDADLNMSICRSDHRLAAQEIFHSGNKHDSIHVPENNDTSDYEFESIIKINTALPQLRFRHPRESTGPSLTASMNILLIDYLLNYVGLSRADDS